MPSFIAAEPVGSKALGALDLKKQNPAVMRYEFTQAIQELAYRSVVMVEPVPPVPPVPPVIRQGRALPFLPTYAFISPADQVPLLPIHPRRRDTPDAIDIWSWVYHCRRVVAPCPTYHVDCPWPSRYSAWVGPDGVPIRLESNQDLEQHQVQLLKCQLLKSKNSEGRK